MISFAVVNRAVYCVVPAQGWWPWYVAMRIKKGCCSAWFLISFVASVVQELGRMSAVLTRHCVADVSVKGNCTSRARENPHNYFLEARPRLHCAIVFAAQGGWLFACIAWSVCKQKVKRVHKFSSSRITSAVCGSRAPCVTLRKWR